MPKRFCDSCKRSDEYKRYKEFCNTEFPGEIERAKIELLLLGRKKYWDENRVEHFKTHDYNGAGRMALSRNIKDDRERPNILEKRVYAAISKEENRPLEELKRREARKVAQEARKVTQEAAQEVARKVREEKRRIHKDRLAIRHEIWECKAEDRRLHLNELKSDHAARKKKFRASLRSEIGEIVLEDIVREKTQEKKWNHHINDHIKRVLLRIYMRGKYHKYREKIIRRVLKARRARQEYYSTYYSYWTRLRTIRDRKARPYQLCPSCGKKHQNRMAFCSIGCMVAVCGLSSRAKAMRRISNRRNQKEKFSLKPLHFNKMRAMSGPPKIRPEYVITPDDYAVSIPTIVSRDDFGDSFSGWDVGSDW